MCAASWSTQSERCWQPLNRPLWSYLTSILYVKLKTAHTMRGKKAILNVASDHSKQGVIWSGFKGICLSEHWSNVPYVLLPNVWILILFPLDCFCVFQITSIWPMISVTCSNNVCHISQIILQVKSIVIYTMNLSNKLLYWFNFKKNESRCLFLPAMSWYDKFWGEI